jgi:dTDP-4-amino-4,6-dideoxygalactose transaminase
MQHTIHAVRVPFVDLKAQYESIKTDIDQAIAAVIEQAAFIGGPFVRSFEESFARYCGVEHCVGVANGTDAIALVLAALGIGAGDEVITAANSFIATSEAVRMAGAQVVFADIDPRTYNIDVAEVERKITGRTRAILPVHLYGQPANMDPILDLARTRRLKVVGDAAQAHGAFYKGRPIATTADATTFSFYPGKNLGAYGDAGAVVTNDGDLAQRVRKLANHGRAKKYDHDIEGVNSRLDAIQAAILSAKLPHLDVWTKRRRTNAARYSQLLADTAVVVPCEPTEVTAVYHLYVIRVGNGQRDALREHLLKNGIDAGVHYPTPLPFVNAYQHLRTPPAMFRHARAASEEILSLPMYAELAPVQQQHVSRSIREFLS